MGYSKEQKAKKIAPNDPKTSLYLAEGFLRTKTAENKDQKEAVPLLEETVSLKPNWADSRKELAKLYSGLGEKDKAAEQYKKILDYFPQAEDIKEKLNDLGK